jgi:hypothetical protein
LVLTQAVYVFIGSVIVGEKWFRIVPGTLVGIVGIGYVVLEYIPSIEPPANMRYVAILTILGAILMFAAMRMPAGAPSKSRRHLDDGGRLSRNPPKMGNVQARPCYMQRAVHPCTHFRVRQATLFE